MEPTPSYDLTGGLHAAVPSDVTFGVGDSTGAVGLGFSSLHPKNRDEYSELESQANCFLTYPLGLNLVSLPSSRLL